ncbi:hypothetical protein E4U21_001963 [Claviceps maximensis]|nr:hypothetical protein E4U21_001963 [Claviceps maximensis]
MTSVDEALVPRSCCVPSISAAPPRDDQMGPPTRSSSAACGGSFFTWSPLGPLLFENESSDARDHCANERTFLSHLRLSIFMAVLSVAITLSFHLNNQPSDLERRMAKPLGAIFWALSLLMLVLGLANYIHSGNSGILHLCNLRRPAGRHQDAAAGGVARAAVMSSPRVWQVLVPGSSMRGM